MSHLRTRDLHSSGPREGARFRGHGNTDGSGGFGMDGPEALVNLTTISVK